MYCFPAAHLLASDEYFPLYFAYKNAPVMLDDLQHARIAFLPST